MGLCSAGFTYILDRLKPRASRLRGRGAPAMVYRIFNTVIGLSHLCCHSVLYFLSNPSVIFFTQLHSISEYCRILNTPHHLCLYWNWLNTLPSSSSREGGELGGASLYLNLALPSCQLSSHKATLSCKCCRNILQNYKMQIFNIKKTRIQ